MPLIGCHVKGGEFDDFHLNAGVTDGGGENALGHLRVIWLRS